MSASDAESTLSKLDGAVLITIVSGRFPWATLKAVALNISKNTAIMMKILMLAEVFALSFRGLQGEELSAHMLDALPGVVNMAVWFMLLIIFMLGFFIE